MDDVVQEHVDYTVLGDSGPVVHGGGDDVHQEACERDGELSGEEAGGDDGGGRVALAAVGSVGDAGLGGGGAEVHGDDVEVLAAGGGVAEVRGGGDDGGAWNDRVPLYLFLFTSAKST